MIVKFLAANKIVRRSHVVDGEPLSLFPKPIPPIYSDRFLIKVKPKFKNF